MSTLFLGLIVCSFIWLNFVRVLGRRLLSEHSWTERDGFRRQPVMCLIRSGRPAKVSWFLPRNIFLKNYVRSSTAFAYAWRLGRLGISESVGSLTVCMVCLFSDNRKPVSANVTLFCRFLTLCSSWHVSHKSCTCELLLSTPSGV